METFMATLAKDQTRLFLIVTGITTPTLVTVPLVAAVYKINQINWNFVVGRSAC